MASARHNRLVPGERARRLLFAGDGHARQGDGEISGTGVEVSMEMEFRLDLRKDWPIRWPRGITSDGVELFTVGNARPAGPSTAARHDRDARVAGSGLRATTPLPPATSWVRPSAMTSATSSTPPTR